MSEGKSNGVPHKVLDQLAKFQAAWETKISEVVHKHNDLAAHITAVEEVLRNVAAFTASELGKIGGTTQKQLSSLAESTSYIDKNVLALAELCKELVGQITQMDFIFQKMEKTFRNEGTIYFSITEDETKQIKADAEQRYTDWVASSFKTVRERMEAEDKADQEKKLLAKEAADRITASEAETQGIEKELQRINLSEMSLSNKTSGGPGSEFPDGAVIFGDN